jgi:amidase/aspartyl-tRNA(Asn)/glutamyl-tRNA(Gln) amidotransferase subunit A
MADDYCFRSATSLSRAVRQGELSPVELVEAHLDRIDRHNDRTNSYVTVVADRARERAREAERAVENGEDLGPLHGVPVAIKDLCPVADVRLTFGSKPFADHTASNTAILVERLQAAGAIVLGKTNACEFGHKGTTDNKLHGPTSTPFDLDHNAGGSSGGSAAAVADGLAPIAHGGDGGGSIRIPASLCGVYGFKPSFGRVPFEARPDGFLEHTPFIHRGPITRTVADAALAMDVMAGPHPADPFSLPAEAGSYRDALDRSVSEFDVAFSLDVGLFPVESAVESTVRDAVDAFRDCGASIEETQPPIDHDRETVLEAWQTGYEVFNATLVDGIASEMGVDYLGSDREEASPEFVAVAERGREYSALESKRAERVRTAVYDAFRTLFEDYDLLVTPTLAVSAVENQGTDTVGPDTVEGEPVDPLIGWALTYPFNMTGHPVASIPAGFGDGTTPIGLQIVGPRHDDDRVLAASAAFERERPWQDAYPPRA